MIEYEFAPNTFEVVSVSPERARVFAIDLFDLNPKEIIRVVDIGPALDQRYKIGSRIYRISIRQMKRLK